MYGGSGKDKSEYLHEITRHGHKEEEESVQCLHEED
jgi:hypothetical protein